MCTAILHYKTVVYIYMYNMYMYTLGIGINYLYTTILCCYTTLNIYIYIGVPLYCTTIEYCTLNSTILIKNHAV